MKKDDKDKIHFKLKDIHLRDKELNDIDNLYIYMIKDLLEIITLFDKNSEKIIPVFFAFNNTLEKKIKIFDEKEG
ncbi:MAG: hypothetical protein HUJ88_09290 [Fusobacterium necrophorum]|nr:hypothetical protein [Fusobacterium necrophorum]